YDYLVRFPNLSSIAAARFMREASCSGSILSTYWTTLAQEIKQAFDGDTAEAKRQRFAARTKGRPTYIVQTDCQINPNNSSGHNFNGVMFSSKWLAEDMSLDKAQGDRGDSDVSKLRHAVDQAHQRTGLTGGSPSDWWAIVLADGDSMGQYISGSKLETYEAYLVKAAIANKPAGLADLCREQKRMGPATHVGLNRALLDFSNRLVPYLTEQRCCGKVIYSGGDDVMAVLPIEDLPEYLRSLRAAWRGADDPGDEFFHGEGSGSGYWQLRPGTTKPGIPNRPLFTMGNTATMSMGIVIAHKSVPLPTVLESLWSAEKDRAKKMMGKDGLCFRVIYGGGNTLEALMKGSLLEQWWAIAQQYESLGDKLAPVLHRLAEELPKRVNVDAPALFALAAEVIMERRDDTETVAALKAPMMAWLNAWAHWVHGAAADGNALGATTRDLGYLLRFTAFWVDKMVQRQAWQRPAAQTDGDRQPTLARR
ncbi:MAG: type III-B CRISPR-associated protein Cas10/Cmr2, partial [Elainellaceae cyanobacterium]